MSEFDLVAVGALLATIGAAIAYHRLTGNASGVDIDHDGADEITFEDEDESEGEQTLEEDIVQSAPPFVYAIGENLTELDGIGDSKAQNLIDEGFETAEDLYFAADEEIQQATGIGPHLVETIREQIGSSDE